MELNYCLAEDLDAISLLFVTLVVYVFVSCYCILWGVVFACFPCFLCSLFRGGVFSLFFFTKRFELACILEIVFNTQSMYLKKGEGRKHATGSR